MGSSSSTSFPLSSLELWKETKSRTVVFSDRDFVSSFYSGLELSTTELTGDGHEARDDGIN